MSLPLASPPTEPQSRATPRSERSLRDVFGKRSTLLALPFGSAPLDSEEGRLFLQGRLNLFARLAILLGVSAFVATHLIQQLTIEGHPLLTCLREHGGIWHAFAAAIPALVYLLTRRRALSLRALYLTDTAGTLLALGAYAMMSLEAAPHSPGRVEFVMMLTAYCWLMARAVIIPSTLLHTVLVGIAGTLPPLLLAIHTGSAFPSTDPLAPSDTKAWFIVIWIGLLLVLSGVTSQSIFGLRAQVRRAERLGQYELDEKIGEGGMGQVYKARHALLRRPTAVKLVSPERAGMDLLTRFEREVQHTAMLTHPNTVSIYDYGRTPEGVFYYAMEYLDGIDLDQLVARFGPQPPERVVSILSQVLGSLAEAHASGLVHRDIKPGNVILCERGGVPDTAKVVDFGLVKDLSEIGRGKPHLSSVNALLGTPLYLSPEAVANPHSVDARSDLYALGAVAYYLLTGTPVFTGASVVEVCAQHLHTEPVSPSIRSGRAIPPALENMVLRCLAKLPEKRPQSAAQVLEELSLSGVPHWTPEQARAWWREHGVAARVTRGPKDARAQATIQVNLAHRA